MLQPFHLTPTEHPTFEFRWLLSARFASLSPLPPESGKRGCNLDRARTTRTSTGSPRAPISGFLPSTDSKLPTTELPCRQLPRRPCTICCNEVEGPEFFPQGQRFRSRNTEDQAGPLVELHGWIRSQKHDHREAHS